MPDTIQDSKGNECRVGDVLERLNSPWCRAVITRITAIGGHRIATVARGPSMLSDRFNETTIRRQGWVRRGKGVEDGG